MVNGKISTGPVISVETLCDDDKEMNPRKIPTTLEEYKNQVQEIIKEMYEEKASILVSIRRLYEIDETRTCPETNNMLWVDFLKQNTTTAVPQFNIRESIAALIDEDETSSAVSAVKRGKGKGKFTSKKVTPSFQRTRTAFRPAFGGLLNTADALLSTPMDQGITTGLRRQQLITPKFDLSTPLLPHTLRKPMAGEIAVSLQGSPLQVTSEKKELDFDKLTRVELNSLIEKVNKLQSM